MIELRTSPHMKSPLSLPQIMRHVVYAIIPICLFAIYQFGISALALIITVTLSCLLTELLLNKLSDKKNTLHDYSALITGLLLALTLPPGFPLWMGAVAGFIAIAMGKTLFGGIGFNLFNPALLGRAFVQAAFPVAITSWTPAGLDDRFTQFVPSSLTFPFTIPLSMDGLTGATPLALQKFEATTTPVSHLFFGFSNGSIGETSTLLILICGAYLIVRGIMGWRIPLAIIIAAIITSGVFFLFGGFFQADYPSPLFMLTSGGLMLGALFMATDPVSAPVTPAGMWIFGLLIGVMTIIIRLFGGLPEGIMYAILFANASVPLIEAISQPRKFGYIKKKEDKS
ncbi:MAG: electron transporter RnfD [Gammaproteobacteria bacterium]|nr:MAG: electron transporter RnfD [Gammaproteobacteria bacterium]